MSPVYRNFDQEALDRQYNAQTPGASASPISSPNGAECY